MSFTSWERRLEKIESVLPMTPALDWRVLSEGERAVLDEFLCSIAPRVSVGAARPYARLSDGQLDEAEAWCVRVLDDQHSAAGV